MSTRKRITSIEQALRDLPSSPSRPSASLATTLPFSSLTQDEFEIFCFLLLGLERDEGTQNLFYLEKTRHRPRDIIRQFRGGGCVLIQCKMAKKKIGASAIRAELAHLFASVHSGTVVPVPDRVALFAAPDLTASAAALLNPRAWRRTAAQAIRAHLDNDPGPDLLKHALTWWPSFGIVNADDLNVRARLLPNLVREFFTFPET